MPMWLKRRKVRIPWVPRALLFSAHWPGKEYTNQRLALHFRYGRMMRQNEKQARRILMKETQYNVIATFSRSFWALVRMLRAILSG
ncbi:MAG: hypothetical protein AAFS07_15890 [Pseudomonadota bacterium]